MQDESIHEIKKSMPTRTERGHEKKKKKAQQEIRTYKTRGYGWIRGLNPTKP